MSETGKKPYYELVHVGEFDIEYGTKPQAMAHDKAWTTNVRELQSQGHTMHFFYGDPHVGVLNDQVDEIEVPAVDKDTPIIVGGADWQICCHARVQQLRKKGFTNVSIDQRIALAFDNPLLNK